MNPQGSRRIHIVGGPGSGKTTLARKVAIFLQAPFVELDVVGYENGSGAERPMEVRLTDIHRIAVQPSWVTEGIFLGWTDELFKTADQVVWLDLPWRLVGWRIFIRHIRAELRGNNRHPGWMKLYRFMQWSRSYYISTAAVQDVVPDTDIGETRVITEKYLAAFQDKLARCASPAQVKAYIEEFSPAHPK